MSVDPSLSVPVKIKEPWMFPIPPSSAAPAATHAERARVFTSQTEAPENLDQTQDQKVAEVDPDAMHAL